MENEETKLRFDQHKRRALRRGIGFELSFEQWLAMWGDKIDQRGTHRGQYVMCRKNDIGPYAVGNCYIATGRHNLQVRGFKETRTHSKPADFDDLRDARRHAEDYGDPLAQLIAEEEAKELAA